MSQAQHESNVFDLVKRLATGDWLTKRSSASGLIAASYKFCSSKQKEELITFYTSLSKDESVMVRRCAAIALKVSLFFKIFCLIQSFLFFFLNSNYLLIKQNIYCSFFYLLYHFLYSSFLFLSILSLFSQRILFHKLKNQSSELLLFLLCNALQWMNKTPFVSASPLLLSLLFLFSLQKRINKLFCLI